MQPVALIILDGWGLAAPGPGNAVDLAATPTFDRLHASCPRTTLRASGLDVGLPDGQIGNSEVGHLNLGAGRVVHQDLTRIDMAIADGSFARNDVLEAACDRATSGRGVLHIVGLASRGGVHSQLTHIVQLARMAAARGVRSIRVHAITDGRDVAPTASLTDLDELDAQLASIAVAHDGSAARIVSLIGRYWAMDRDQRWERTQRMVDLLLARAGQQSPSAGHAARQQHESGVTDEFFEPFVIGDPSDGIDAGDPVIFANFRPDRMRQLVGALIHTHAPQVERPPAFRPLRHVTTMCEYDPTFDVSVAFAPVTLDNVLADVLETHGVGQLHVAETEKYAHVTYFFNGGVEREHAGELRRLAPSPRDVATYDQKPEMSCRNVADLFIEAIADEHIGFAVLNFANPDMVGHTGSIPAAIAACEAVDEQLARVVAAVHERGGTLLVTADHGNAECMLSADGTPHTAHTTNLVPLLLVRSDVASPAPTLRAGRLADIAPTVLDLLDIPLPLEMTGTSLLQPAPPVTAA